MRFLTVEEYDRVEKDALRYLSNRMIEAFQPVHFAQAGYPVRVYQEQELWRYIDVMHLLRYEEYVSGLLGGLTAQEFEQYKSMTKVVVDLSRSLFRKKALARCSLLGSLNVFRHIKYLWGDQRPRILEIGPGCGYLGALLMRERYPYAAMDIAQAFYLYQNRLWNTLVPAMEEYASQDPAGVKPLAVSDTGRVAHIPWWQFCRLSPETIGEGDVVTVNHALCEMHPHAMRFVLKIARSFLKGQGMKKAFLFEGWGATAVSHPAKVVEAFYQAGYVLVHADTWITVFVPKENTYSSGYLPLPRQPEKGRTASDTAQWGPYFFSSPTNQFSSAIRACRQRETSEKTIGAEILNDFHRETIGDCSYLTDDERFWRFVFE